VEPRAALLARDAERLLLPRIDDAEAERRQRASLREHVERRPLLREEHRVAPRQRLHARAELQLPGPPGGERERGHGLGDGPRGALRAPERVEPVDFESVDELREAVARSGELPRPAGEADPYLHPSPSSPAWEYPTIAVAFHSSTRRETDGQLPR